MIIEPSDSAVESPCIRLCTLDGNDICVGCFRHISEITGWHSATNEMKRAILDRAKERRNARQ